MSSQETANRGPVNVLGRPFGFTAALIVSTGLMLFAPAAEPAAAQDLGACEVQFHSAVSEEGFVHPGVGLTEPILQNVRDQIAAGEEPWTSGFEAMRQSSAAAEDVGSSNANGDGSIRSDAFNSQGFNGRFIADGQKAYTQAVMYVLTGEVVYRKNALDIIRVWEQMDPEKYEYFTDAHIHTGVPLYRMVSAAELLRYTSCGEDEEYPWTETDTQAFNQNLVMPAIETYMSSPDHFMNQHNYPLLGSMAGSIFMDDQALYEEKVEWYTVNDTAKDDGFNGSISRLLRWVGQNDKTGEPIDTPHVQLTEMGRDQAHAGGDLTNIATLARMLLAQDTKVDPVHGTVSTSEDAVGPYEFLDDRILQAADYFWQYMLGYDTEWTPIAYAISPDGTIRDTYNSISPSYRGRYVTASVWEVYWYYKFTLGEDVESMAPYLSEAYAMRPPPLYHRGGGVGNAWDIRDGGGDRWLFAPPESAGEATYQPGDSPTEYEIEQRYTDLNGTAETIDGYVRLPEGSRIAYLNGEAWRSRLGFLVRTEGEAVIHLGSTREDSIIVPDTGGEWRYVTVDRGMGDLLYIETEGATVDIDHIDINASEELTPPEFTGGSPDRIVGWAGATITADLSATAAEGTTYNATGLPDGAEFDQDTGALTWTPAEAGSWTITVEADDGTIAAAHRFTFVTGDDRGAALTLAAEGHDPEAAYESATTEAYTAAYAAAEDLRKGGSDAEYRDTLAEVVTAVDGLRLISPKTDFDGSLDYPDLVVDSTTGDRIRNLVDDDNHSGTGYFQAVDLSHTFDFGLDFRVSATEFGFQSNIFADRLATAVVFGSNDGATWTRLTPGEADYTQDFNTELVVPDLQDDQWRYLKVQLMDPQPDVLYGIVRNLFEMTEFHIYGERHEIGNQIETASIGSDQAVAGKIAIGETVDVTVTTKTPVDSVTVDVEGIAVEATSEDGVDWTASAVLEGVEPGDVTLAVNYTDAYGEVGPTLYGTTDGTKLYVGGNADNSVDVGSLATVVASDKEWPGDGLSAEEVGYLLFDGDAETAGDLITGESAYYTIDFGEGASVHLDEVFMLPRSCCVDRANGVIVQASNDGETWTDLTEELSGAAANTWTRRDVNDEDHYRHFRIFNANRWHGNLSEVQFYGDFQYDDSYFESRVRDTGTSTRASAYLYQEEITRLREALADDDADRTAILNDLNAAADLLVPQSSLFSEVEVDQAGVVASSISWDGSVDAAENGWRAFDGDPATSPDTETAEGWVMVDLGEDGAVPLAGVEYLPRGGNHARADGAQVQGSNDGESWETLATISGVSSVEWGTVPIEGATAYRYLRYYTPNGFANVAELVFVERAVDRTLLELLLDRAALRMEADWTPESWTVLADAVAEGETVLENADADQGAVDGAADAVAFALDDLIWNVPDWESSELYPAGSRVHYDGRVWVSQWSTRGRTPGESNYGAWSEVGEPVFCGEDRITTWTASSLYRHGDEVYFDGSHWRARWWTRNSEPAEGPGHAWELVGAC